MDETVFVKKYCLSVATGKCLAKNCVLNIEQI